MKRNEKEKNRRKKFGRVLFYFRQLFVPRLQRKTVRIPVYGNVGAASSLETRTNDRREKRYRTCFKTVYTVSVCYQYFSHDIGTRARDTRFTKKNYTFYRLTLLSFFPTTGVTFKAAFNRENVQSVNIWQCNTVTDIFLYYQARDVFHDDLIRSSITKTKNK